MLNFTGAIAINKYVGFESFEWKFTAPLQKNMSQVAIDTKIELLFK
jgi:hypothetical protein